MSNMIRDSFSGVPKMSIELHPRAAIFDAEADRDFLDDFEQGGYCCWVNSNYTNP